MICVLNSNTASKQDHTPRTEQKNAVPIWKQKQRILAKHAKKEDKQMNNAALDPAIMKQNTGEKKPHDQAPKKSQTLHHLSNPDKHISIRPSNSRTVPTHPDG
jgi:hypothetical protein